MKTLLKFIFLFFIPFVISCSENKKTNKQTNNDIDQVTKAMKEGLETFSKLDELEKEIKDNKNGRELTGYLKGNLNEKTINITSWNSGMSRGSLFDNKIAFHFFIGEKESISFVIQAKNLYDAKTKKDLCATNIPYKVTDTKFLEKFNKGFASVSYINGNTKEKWSSADGEVIIETLTPTNLKINWKGSAFLGDWKEKKLVPFEAEANLQYNFISDLRNLN